MKAPHRVIGVDESGKGDFFGPLVIAAFVSCDSDRPLLQASGVRDGKLISERRLLEIDQALRKDFSHEILVIPPGEYNRRHKEIKNLNKLLADGHAEVIDRLLRREKADRAISDKFGKPELVQQALTARARDIELEQIVRGESILQVAAASIIARARFLREMEQLEFKLGCELPRGAAPRVDEAGRKIVRRFGAAILSDIAKTHFKNFQRIVNPTLFGT